MLLRENQQFHVGRLFPIVRSSVLELGGRLHEGMAGGG